MTTYRQIEGDKSDTNLFNLTNSKLSWEDSFFGAEALELPENLNSMTYVFLAKPSKLLIILATFITRGCDCRLTIARHKCLGWEQHT